MTSRQLVRMTNVEVSSELAPVGRRDESSCGFVFLDGCEEKDGERVSCPWYDVKDDSDDEGSGKG